LASEFLLSGLYTCRNLNYCNAQNFECCKREDG
jgi:hypothetical protein